MTDQPALTNESRRCHLKAIGTAGLTTGLAGCSGGDGGNGDGGDGGGDSDNENNTGSGGDDDSSGDGEDYEAIGNFPPEGNSISIGFNGSTSGVLGPDGQNQEKGFDLAVKHLNEDGGLVDYWDRLNGDGIMNYQVESTKADTAGNAGTAQDNIKRVIQRDNIQFWTGGMSSTVMMVIQNVAR